MQKHRNFKGALLLLLSLMCFLTGCTRREVKIFKTEEDTGIKGYKDVELLMDDYYIKDGATFYPIYKIGSFSSSGSILNPTDVKWTFEKEDAFIPVYYSNEMISFKSKELEERGIRTVRYKDMGYSIGLAKCKYDLDGYLQLVTEENAVSGSEIFNAFSQQESNQIRIVSVNGKDARELSIDCGIIMGLEKNAEVTVEYYAGSKYLSTTVKADTHFYAPFEIYALDAQNTKNGYFKLQLPEDAKTGFYEVDGKGVFQYVAGKKGIKYDELEHNEAYYESEETQLLAYTQGYRIEVPNRTENIGIKIEYDLESTNKALGSEVFTENDLAAIILSPSGKRYEVFPNSGQMTCELAEAESGTWKVNILPKELMVSDVSVYSTKKAGDALQETFDFDITEGQSSMVFRVLYEGKGEIWATCTDEAGNTKEFTDETLTCSYAYLSEGTYTVTVYHYPDTKITDVTLGLDTVNDSVEIITVEE